MLLLLLLLPSSSTLVVVMAVRGVCLEQDKLLAPAGPTAAAAFPPSWTMIVPWIAVVSEEVHDDVDEGPSFSLPQITIWLQGIIDFLVEAVINLLDDNIDEHGWSTPQSDGDTDTDTDDDGWFIMTVFAHKPNNYGTLYSLLVCVLQQTTREVDEWMRAFRFRHFRTVKDPLWCCFDLPEGQTVREK